MSDSKQVRRLAAVLVADAVGYSGLMRAAEDATHRQYKTDLASLFMPTLTKYSGRLVKTTGDGLLAEFSSIVDCVKCAVDLQKIASSEPERLKYRIGINLADIIAEDNDIYGDGVNVASRLQTLARPGGIALSADAYNHVAGKLDVAFEDLGEQQVRSIEEPLRIYRINFTDLKEKSEPGSTVQTRTKSVTIPSILVLPFTTIGRGNKVDDLGFGITNDIITALSKFVELFVVTSNRALSLKDKKVTVSEWTQELDVRYVVSGSIQRVAQDVRVSVQLIETATYRQLWAEQYEHRNQELLREQGKAVEKIVGALITRLDRSENQRILHKEANNLEPYDLYLRGRSAWRQWTWDANKLAQHYFQRTIDLDPHFAPAYGYLSYTLVQAWLSGWNSSPEQLQRARTLARKAVALEPENFENHWCLAMAVLYGRELDVAIATFQHALQMNPHSSGLHIDMADALVFDDKPEEALVYVERAAQLGPANSDAHLWTKGIALYHFGDFHGSLNYLLRIANPPNLALRHLAAVYVRLGEIEKAKRTAADFLLADPDYTLERERIWPYRNVQTFEAFVSDLKTAGLPLHEHDRA